MVKSVRIFILSGVSGAGKSEAGLALAERLGCSCIELDRYRVEMARAPASNSFSPRDMAEFARAVALQLLCDFQKSGVTIVVEGGDIWPEVARRFVEDGTAWAGFLGYEHATPQTRLDLLRSGAGKIAKPHWVAQKSDAEALAHIARQIQRSTDCRLGCEAAGLPYFDCTYPHLAQPEVIKSALAAHE